MFERFKFRKELSKLQRERRRTEKDGLTEIKRLRRGGKDAHEIQIYKDVLAEDVEYIDDEIVQLESRFLVEQAQLLRVPTPSLLVADDVSDDWKQSELSGAFYLTDLACARLRSDIRKERKERWEEWTRWTPLLSSLTGLLGVVVAIVALAVRANH